MKFLVVGLGNIGPEYDNTRHNVGFRILDQLAEEEDLKFESVRYGDMVKYKYRGRTFLLLKPSTFMNLSGNAIRYWMQKENISDQKLLVITDDIALPLGTARLRAKGSDGGHNGLSHIIQTLGHNKFARLRVGVGNEFSKGRQVNYVLGEWTGEELKELEEPIERAVKVIKAFGTIGMERTMNEYNKK